MNILLESMKKTEKNTRTSKEDRTCASGKRLWGLRCCLWTAICHYVDKKYINT